jgi:hypothetical protein
MASEKMIFGETLMEGDNKNKSIISLRAITNFDKKF